MPMRQADYVTSFVEMNSSSRFCCYVITRATKPSPHLSLRLGLNAITTPSFLHAPPSLLLQVLVARRPSA